MKLNAVPFFQANRRGARRSGFTMIEVLVAITIFSLVSVAIFMVFRTAVRSQRIGARETQIIQRTRYAADSLEKDFANVFFRDETSYNVQMTSMLETYEQVRLEAEATGDWERFEQLYGSPFEDEDEENEPQIGNPFEQGRLIDLQFVGEDEGVVDTITFAVYEPLGEGSKHRPWGLSRVKYSVEEGVLVRTAESVEAPPQTVDGRSQGPIYPPEHAILAEGVQELDFSYGFWYDNQWYEVLKWNSANRQIRNPRYILRELDFQGLEDESEMNRMGPGRPGWNEYLNSLNSEPLDRLPAYVRLKLTLSDPENPDRQYSLRSIYRLPPALETYTRNPQLTEEEQEEERIERDNIYYPVYPGIMEKSPI